MISWFDNIGAVGIIKDIPAHQLPAEAWSGGQNVRFVDGKVRKFAGHSRVFDSSTASPTISIAPYYLQPVATSTQYYWLYAGLSNVYATDGATHTDISKVGGYSATANLSWNGGMLGGIAIVNNAKHGQNYPQQWGSSAGEPDPTVPLVDLSSWPANTYATVIRPFRNFLVALDITEGATRNRHQLMWSTPAPPGTVPDSWDYTDPANRAGTVELKQTQGTLIDCLPMRDVNLIYKQDAVWSMQFIGGNEVFQFDEVFNTMGALSRNCVKNFYGKHFVLVQDDIVVHDGQSHEPILNRRMRDWIFGQLDSINYTNSFVAANYPKNEMWCCIPTSGNEFPDLALVWNWRENSTSVRDLPGPAMIGNGVVDPSGGIITYDADVGSFNSVVGSFDEQNYNPTLRKLLMAVPSQVRLHLLDNTTSFDGLNMTAYVEREAVPLGRVDKAGFQSPDLSVRKAVDAVYPTIDGTAGSSVDVYVGTQEALGDAITWHGPHPFVIGTDTRIPVRVSGRIISIKFQTTGSNDWSLIRYGIEWRKDGER